MNTKVHKKKKKQQEEHYENEMSRDVEKIELKV